MKDGSSREQGVWSEIRGCGLRPEVWFESRGCGLRPEVWSEAGGVV